MYSRLHNIGIVSYVELLAMMCTGPILRSSGITFDLRTWLLDVYTKVSVGVCYSTMCDCYDRIFIRYMEMIESVRLILSGVYFHHIDAVNTRRAVMFKQSITTMEELIMLFVRLCNLGANYCTTVTG
jgi:NADH:ubiquinone oxidoreductase subunit D